MAEDMVMRSVYLRPTEDALLRQLAFDLKVTKSDLIRSAISLKLRDWLASDEDELILKDVEVGRSESVSERAGRVAAAEEEPATGGGAKAARNRSAVKAHRVRDRASAGTSRASERSARANRELAEA